MPDPYLVAEIAEIVRASAKVPPTMEIEPESLLVEDLALDSLDLLAAILRVQDRFGVIVEDEDVERMRRVSDLAAYVTKYREPAAA
jgi:acyl carrier protein